MVSLVQKKTEPSWQDWEEMYALYIDACVSDVWDTLFWNVRKSGACAPAHVRDTDGVGRWASCMDEWHRVNERHWFAKDLSPGAIYILPLDSQYTWALAQVRILLSLILLRGLIKSWAPGLLLQCITIIFCVLQTEKFNINRLNL